MGVAKYGAVFEVLKQEILSGRYEPGKAFPSGQSLADRFGISRPTVNRVMAGLRQEGLVVTRAGAAPRISRYAQHATGVLAVIHPGRRYGGVLSDVCDGLIRNGEENGWDVVVSELDATNPASRVRQMREAIRRLSEERVAGLFLQPFEYLRNEACGRKFVCELLGECGMPTVLLDYDIFRPPERSSYDLVAFDNFSEGMAIGRALLQRGCRRISFLLRPMSPPSVIDRMRGVASAVVDHGGCWSRAGNVMSCEPSARRDIGRFIRSTGTDAIVCGNDATAVVLHKTLGRSCPNRGIAIAGFDAQAEAVSRGIVTIAQPSFALAQVAIRLMLTRLRHPGMPIHTAVVPASGQVVL